MREDNPHIVVPPPLIFGGLLLVGLWFDLNSPNLSLVPISGMLLIGVGITVIILALGLFRKSDTRPEPWKPASALVISGIYERTRNPMYLGMATLSLGIALLFQSVAAVLLVFVATAVIDRFVIVREEAYLRRRFGEAYRVYQSKVRRWL